MKQVREDKQLREDIIVCLFAIFMLVSLPFAGIKLYEHLQKEYGVSCNADFGGFTCKIPF